MPIEPSVLFFLIPVVGILGFIIFQMTTKGVKGAFFGGAVIRKIGSISLGSSAVSSQTLSVYEVDKKGEKHVGFEIVSKAPLGLSSNYFSVPERESKELVKLILDVREPS